MYASFRLTMVVIVTSPWTFIERDKKKSHEANCARGLSNDTKKKPRARVSPVAAIYLLVKSPGVTRRTRIKVGKIRG